MQLIVLGMHRSGTSVLARLLNLMGVYFGPEGISTGANQENPKGFWERKDVRQLNDSILLGVGCDWNRVLKLDLEALPDGLRADFDKRASRLVLELDGHRPWLLKEPRLCLLLPLWRRYMEVPVAIHIHRNPVEVASSLLHRNQMPIEAGLGLWERYVRAAHAGSEGMPQVRVSHHELMSSPAQACARLYRDLVELGVPGLREPSAREVEAFIEPKLYRERAENQELRPYADAPQMALFQRLESSGELGTQEIDPAALAAMARYEAQLPPLPEPVAARPAETLDSLRAQIKQRDAAIAQRIDSLEQSLQHAREPAATTPRPLPEPRPLPSVGKHAETRDALRAQVAFLRTMVERSDLDLRQLDTWLASARRDEQQARAQVNQREATLAHREQRIQALEAALQQAREAASAAQAKAGMLAQGPESALGESEFASRYLQMLEEIGTLRSAVADLEQAADQHRVHFARLNERNAQQHAQLEGQAAELARGEEERGRLRERLAEAEQALQSLQARLQDEEAEHKALADDAARVRESLEQAGLDAAHLPLAIADLLREHAARARHLAEQAQAAQQAALRTEELERSLRARDADLAHLREDAVWTRRVDALRERTARQQAADLRAREDELAQMTRRLAASESELAKLDERLQTARVRAQEEQELAQARTRDMHGQLQAAQAAQAALQAQLADAQAQGQARLAQAREELDGLRRSLSWRITGPLRRVARMLRGQPRGRGDDDARLVEDSGLFDAQWYLQAYPDVARSGIAPLAHFLAHGAAEGRDPGPAFATADYLRRHPDVAASGLNPLIHHLRQGALTHDPTSMASPADGSGTGALAARRPQ